jgi:transcriptional regulator with XRE-family HTH domain
MSQLSENLKVIRNHLKLTQSEFSKTLGIGFRTYVRYEMGERETPIPVLVKVSKLIKESLDDLILSPLVINEFNGLTYKSSKKSPSIVKQTTSLLGLENEQLIASKKDEKNLLSLYREMDLHTREKCLKEMSLLIKSSTLIKNKGVNLSKNQTTKKVAKLKKSSDLPKSVGAKN